MNKGKHTSIKMFWEAECNRAVGKTSVWVGGICLHLQLIFFNSRNVGKKKVCSVRYFLSK